jgi:hypothetical protein
MGSRITRRPLFALGLLLLSGAILSGQVSTARLEGLVTDESGSAVPGATVTATNTRTQVAARATTSVEGFYIFPSLQPGPYSLTVEAPGFRKAQVTGIDLHVSGTLAENVRLEVGSVSESITVESNAVRVQTTDAQISRAVTLRDIDNLPQLGRSPIILAVFQPGVSINPGDVTFSRVNGLRQGSNNSKLDGIDVNDSVVPRLGLSMTANNTDSIEEFRVILNGGKAEYGRNAGAQVELITRSGTNEYHGNAFDYLRNTLLHANNWFNNRSGVARPKYIQNQFGGSFGGKIIKDRTFFFANYQGSRVSQEVVRNRTVLTPEAKQGIFRWRSPGSTAIQSFNIVANDPLRRGIDAEVKKNNLDLLPGPNNTDIGDGLNTAGFRFNNPAGSSNNQVTYKVDHNLTSTNRIFFRHSWFKTQSIDALNNADARYPGREHGRQGGIRWGISIGSDWAISTTLVNEARFGKQSASVDFLRPDRPKGPALVSNLWDDALNPAFGQGRNSPVYDFTDNLTSIHGKHTLKIGGTYRRTLQYGYNDAGIYPNVTFARAQGNLPPASIGPSGGVITSADRQRFENLYNDLLGRMDQVTVTYYSNLEKFQPAGTGRVRNTIIREAGFFFQDDWKVTRNLTLNIGLRWELFSPPYERDGLQGKLDRPELIGTVSNVSDFRVQKTNSWFNSDKNNFAPRFGFAWDPKGDGRLAIRGSYGIFFDRQIGATYNSVDGNTPGFSQQVPVFPNSAAGSDARVSMGIPVPPQPGAPILQQPLSRQTTIFTFLPDLRTGYVQHFSLNIQKEILRNTVVDVGYVGTRGVKLFTWLEMNQPKVYGDFEQSFRQIQAFRASGAAVPATNTLVRLFGSPAAAVTAIGAGTFDNALLGSAADTVDRSNFSRYTAAGVSNFYLRNFPQYNQVVTGTNNGQSAYDSLQASLRRQAGDLRFNLNYTFSKSIDNVSLDGNGFTAPIDNYNLALNRGRGDYDRPHVFNGSLIYTLPVGNGKRFGSGLPGWAGALAGGWDFGFLAVMQSGSTFTVNSGRRTGPSTLNTWANYTGSRTIGKLEKLGDSVVWFAGADRARFDFPGAGEIGTSGRNAFRGPWFMNIDMSMVKQFRIREGHSVSFRWEFYNLFNQPMFANPAVNIATPQSFGRISATTANNPRIMQLALRYDF